MQDQKNEKNNKSPKSCSYFPLLLENLHLVEYLSNHTTYSPCQSYVTVYLNFSKTSQFLQGRITSMNLAQFLFLTIAYTNKLE
jgi:hypothetical protein